MADDITQPRNRGKPVALAARFLFPIGEIHDENDPAWLAAGHWLAIWGLIIGLAYLVVFRVTWRWFGEYQGIRWMPAAAVLAADLGFFGYRLLSGTTHLRVPASPGVPTDVAKLTLGTLVAVMLITIAKYAMLLSLPVGMWRSPPNPDWYLPGWLRILCPDEVIYRPLLLAPIWGRWAIGLAMSIGRVSAGESERMRRLASGLSLRRILVQWAIITVLTMSYCALRISSGTVFISSDRTLAYGLVISIVVLLCAYLASFLLARLGNGQTESSVRVAGLTAELAFLTLYVRMASIIYWY